MQGAMKKMRIFSSLGFDTRSGLLVNSGESPSSSPSNAPWAGDLGLGVSLGKASEIGGSGRRRRRKERVADALE